MAADQKGLSLYEIIGAPLHALVEAETHAARATAEFIRDFGFEKRPSESKGDVIDDFGKLRTVTFIQEKRERDGELVQYRIEIPLLSLVPIPALQIKDAELEFYVKILETLRTKVRKSVAPKKNTVNENGEGGEEDGQIEKMPSTSDKSSFFSRQPARGVQRGLGTELFRRGGQALAGHAGAGENPRGAGGCSRRAVEAVPSDGSGDRRCRVEEKGMKLFYRRNVP